MANFIDMTGTKIGNLTILSKIIDKSDINSNKDCAYWLCKCDCGNTQVFRGTSLRNKDYIQCSECSKKARIAFLKSKRVNNVGLKVNKLTIIKDLDERNDRNKLLCLARCDCGNEIKTEAINIKRGNTKSCGCLKIELLKSYAEKARKIQIGNIFTYLTVIDYGEVIYKENYYYSTWLCKCICGKEAYVKSSYLKLGEVTSCGCKTPERLSLAKGGTGIPYENIEGASEFIRHSKEYKDWRIKVFKKYDYTCQISGKRGGTLHVHHINSLSNLIKKYNITKENYLDYSKYLFNIKNGIVILESIHDKFHLEYGHAVNKKQLNKFIKNYNKNKKLI